LRVLLPFFHLFFPPSDLPSIPSSVLPSFFHPSFYLSVNIPSPVAHILPSNFYIILSFLIWLLFLSTNCRTEVTAKLRSHWTTTACLSQSSPSEAYRRSVTTNPSFYATGSPTPLSQELPLLSILNQTNQVHTLPFYLFQIHLNAIPNPMLISLQWSCTSTPSTSVAASAFLVSLGQAPWFRRSVNQFVYRK
jgi:hypothetical protein